VELVRRADILLQDAEGAYIYMALGQTYSDDCVALHPTLKSSMGPLNGNVIQQQQLIVDKMNPFFEI